MISTSLQALVPYHQFILYKLVPSLKTGKSDKIPLSYTTLTPADPHNPVNWGSYDLIKSVQGFMGPLYGVGFVFTENDPFFFLDIDHCLLPDYQWSTLAQQLLAMLPGAAVEVSQSGKGLHVIGCTSRVAHSCKNTVLKLELYTELRFVALTDVNTIGNAATDCTANLQKVVDLFFPPTEDDGKSEDWRDHPVPEWGGIVDDTKLIERALKSESAKNKLYGDGVSFADLWTGNTPALSKAYPPLNDVDPYDRSSADSALCQHLAFWTGKDHERIKRLMLQSALVRDKWTHHKKYLGMTITNGVNKQRDVHKSRPVQPVAPVTPVPGIHTPAADAPAAHDVMSTGIRLLTPHVQLDHFKGCAYVRDIHRVFTPDGSMLKPEQFRATYGGYLFSMDALNEKTTKNAWECFTESQAIKFPKVHSTCFRPELPTGTIISEESYTLVNTYVPIDTNRIPGNVDPFFNFFRKVLPNEQDQQIMLAYMAACVQYKGVKFQWCPLIQGAEGNGKTLLGNVVAFAIGNRYTHLPNAADLGGNGVKFNSWIRNKLLIVIEEIYTRDKRDITEPLKVLITNTRIEIQGKGQDQYTGDNRANFILFSNHKDALYVTNDSRRYCIMYSGQQSKREIELAGMGGDFFPKLYNWLKNHNGYQYMNEFLHTYTIPDALNPAGSCQRAPITTSFKEAITLSQGTVEAEILEAIDEPKPGFAKPYISSMQLDKLLLKINAARQIPNNKRPALLEKLGYVKHPALVGGRLNQIVPYEAGKPRLYVLENCPEIHLTSGVDIYTDYLKSQGYPAELHSNVQRVDFNK